MNAYSRLLRRQELRATRGGFTLIELTIALVAGLIVGIAVVALSKEATNTFHEEMRSSAAEMGLRTAIDRLRADLARAAYMSTPSIVNDPNLATGYVLPADLQVVRLTGIRSYWEGSLAKVNLTGAVASTMNGTDEAAPALSGVNGLHPDAIDISGNLTGADAFYAGIGTNAGTCGGTQLNFEVTSPAMLAILATPGATGPVDALNAMFLPAGMARGVARVVNDSGKTQYVAVCAVNATVGPPSTATIDVGPVVGLGGFATGRITINPVNTVRWRIGPTHASYAALNPTGDTGRYDLYRSFVDAGGADVGTPELIAEYAVDLKFAWTKDTGTAAVPLLNTIGFDDIAAKTVTDWQKLRSVRVRLATRTALPDRNRGLTLIEAGNYLFRYDTGKGFARVRTITTEVALQNQARSWW